MIKPIESKIPIREVTSLAYGRLSQIISQLDSTGDSFGDYYDKIREEVSKISAGELDTEDLEYITNLLQFIKNLIYFQNNGHKVSNIKMAELRHLQKLAITGFINFLIWSFENHRKTGFIVIPTGQGKTILSLVIARENPKKTIIIANDNNGVSQFLKEAKDLGIPDEDYSGRDIEKEKGNSKKIIICTWQAFESGYMSGKFDLGEYSTIFIDEADVNGLSDKRKNLLESINLLKQVTIIALSATEKQASGKELSDFYDYDILRFPMPGSLPELHKLGEVPDTAFQDIILEGELNISSIGNDIPDSEVDKFIDASNWINQILDYHMRFNEGKKFILGMRNNKLNEYIVRLAKNKKINIEPLTGEMSQEERGLVIEKLRQGLIDGIVGSRLSGRGLDIPECSVVYNSLLTYSPQLFWQLAGRGIRLDTGDEGKHSELITFLPSNVYIHETSTPTEGGGEDIIEQKDDRTEVKEYVRPLCFGAFFQKDYFTVNVGENHQKGADKRFELRDLSEEEMRTIDDVNLYFIGIREYGHYMGRPEVLTSIIRHSKGRITMHRLLSFLFQLRGKHVDTYIKKEGAIAHEDDIEYNRVLTRYQGRSNNEQLTLIREKSLFMDYHATNDPKKKQLIRDEILNYHYPIIIALAQKFKNDFISIEDLVQAGAMEVVAKFDNFIPNSRFSSFCGMLALSGILEYIDKNQSLIYISAKRRRLGKRIMDIAQGLENTNGGRVTYGEIARVAGITGITSDTVVDLLREAHTFETFNTEKHAGIDFETPDIAYEKTELGWSIRGFLKGLKEQDKAVIELKFGIKDGIEKSNIDVAKILGISDDQVGRIIERVLQNSNIAHSELYKYTTRYQNSSYFNLVQHLMKVEEEKKEVLKGGIIEESFSEKKIAEYFDTSVEKVRKSLTEDERIVRFINAGKNGLKALESLNIDGLKRKRIKTGNKKERENIIPIELNAEAIIGIGGGIDSADDFAQRSLALEVRNQLRILANENPERFKEIIRELLECDEVKRILSDIGIIYEGNGKWNLNKASNNLLRTIRIGPTSGESFPNRTWNIKHNIGKNGLIKGIENFGSMLISVGYRSEDISLPIAEWNGSTDLDEYNRIVTNELEKPENIKTLESVGIHFNPKERSWIISTFRHEAFRSTIISGRRLQTFPCGRWIGHVLKKEKNTKVLTGKDELKKMLLGLGYASVDILP